MVVFRGWVFYWWVVGDLCALWNFSLCGGYGFTLGCFIGGVGGIWVLCGNFSLCSVHEYFTLDACMLP